MKRFISVIAAISIIMTMQICVPVSAEIRVSKTMLNALEILQFLEIVDNVYDETNLNAEREITRADFAIYLMKLLNQPKTEMNRLYYNDVPKTHYAYDEITWLTENMYMIGIEEGSFKPDEIMEQEHALSVILRVMGYGPYADVKMARQDIILTDLTENVSANSKLLLGDLILMMYNALLTGCAETDTISSQRKIKVGDETLLERTRNMCYEKRGRITGAEGVSIYAQEVDYDEVIIDDKLYLSEFENMIDHIGSYVSYIYHIDDDMETNQIVWFRTVSDNSLHIRVNADSSFDASNWTLTYCTENNRKKTISVPRNIVVIYNGGYLTDSVSAVFSEERYELTLIETDGNEYGAAVIKAYKNIMVSGKDSNKMLVYDKIHLQEVNFDSYSYEKFILRDASGADIGFENISENDIISIFASKDGNVFEAVRSRNVISGNVDGYDEDDGISVDGMSYEFYEKSTVYSVNGAKSITLYLDSNGYIAYFNTTYASSNRFVAYAYDGKYNEEDNCLVFKVLNENGTLERLYTTSYEIKIDRKKYTDMDEALSYMGTASNGNFKPQIILLEKNADGKINAIFKASDNGGLEDVLIKHKTLAGTTRFQAMARDWGNVIGAEMLYDANTKIFKVPADNEVLNAAASRFSVVKPKDQETYLGAVSYKITPDDVFYEQYIVYKGANNVSFSVTVGLMMVDNVYQKVNADDDIVTVVKGLHNGKEVEYEIDPAYLNVNSFSASRGDMIRVAFSVDGKLINYTVVYKYGQDRPVEIEKANGDGEYRVFSGYVHAKLGTAMKIGFASQLDDDVVVDLKSSGSGAVYVYDTGENRVYKGTHEDISAYKNSSRGSFVIVHINRGMTYCIGVYK